jgi:hypothetical protein
MAQGVEHINIRCHQCGLIYRQLKYPKERKIPTQVLGKLKHKRKNEKVLKGQRQTNARRKSKMTPQSS